MKCETAERELSARLDGAGDPRVAEELSGHLSNCSSCRSFHTGALELREHLRLEVAEPVRNRLLEQIMDKVSEKRPARARFGTWRARPLAAAFLLGAIVTAVVVSGIAPRSPRTALATEIPQMIAAASGEVSEYRATFDITELNFLPEVPVRRFESKVDFYARERFRMVTKDLSRYPAGNWPHNDTSLEVDQGRWRLTSPRTCPRLALPDCGGGAVEERSIVGREPFDSDAALPTDMILPLRTLAGTEKVDVAGTSKVSGREAVDVKLAYRDALPLFAFLHAGGSWRPFHPSDQVVVSLDRESWFPLAFEVRVSTSSERPAWAAAQEVAQDRPGSVIFEASIRDLSYSVDPSEPGITLPLQNPRDAGFIDLDLESLVSRTGYTPVEPAELAGLTRYRSGVYSDPARSGEALVSYTRGLSWVKVRQTRTWSQPALFGNIGSLAAPVDLAGGGVAYYEPATGSLGRRLSIHADRWDLYLETNLPAAELLRIAGSLPVRGLPAPPEWDTRNWPGGIVREQITLSEAKDRAPYLRMPAPEPEGYDVAAVHLVHAAGAEGVTVFLRRPGMEPDGVGIRIHQAPGQTLPPPLDPDVSQIAVGDLTLRYSPGRSEVEWIEGGVYRSISAASFDLPGLTELVESMPAAAR